MIVELGFAIALSGQPQLTLQTNPLAERDRVQQLMVKDVNEKLAKQTALKIELATKSADVEAQLKAADAAVQDLKSFFVEPAKYAPTSNVNAYAWGNCTWYVKTQRPDIGAFWGNANMWTNSAIRHGFTTGSAPRVGAIGVSQEGWAGHVFMVESMSRDRSTITVSEMNYAGGVGKVNVRTISSAGFSYIYNLE